jgi:hypothetical protein
MKELIDAIKECYAPLTDEQAMRVFVSRLMNMSRGMKIVYIFPDETKLAQVKVYGIPPDVGEEVNTHQMWLNVDDKRHEYFMWHGWRVKERVFTVSMYAKNPEDHLKNTLNGIESNEHIVEIYLHKGKRYDDVQRV